MANLGSYTVVLKEPHLGWGTDRRTGTREQREGEAYIPIPAEYARSLGLFNENATGGNDVLGTNVFNCRSSDDLFCGLVKSQGNSNAGDVYAKQFAGNDDLRAIGRWYQQIHAAVGDVIEVSVVSPSDIVIRKI